MDDWTLNHLVREATRQLAGRGLAETRDGRVSTVPDARTIRYYTTLGLLDRPRVLGRQARYGRRHLLQLLAIKALQGSPATPSLAEIQSRLYGRSDAELEALLAAAAERQPARGVRVVRWIEVPVEPGLKILAEEGWSPADPEALEARVRAALAALVNAPRGAEGGRKS